MALPATIIKYLSQKQYTEAEAEQAWAEYIARALPFEVRYRVWLKSQFRRQHQEVDVQLRFYEDRALRGIITKINADEVIFNADKWRVIFSEFGQLMLPQIIETQGQAEMTAIIDLRFDLLNPGVQSFIRGRNFKFSFDTNQTTIDQLRSQLDEGLRLGEGIPKLKKRVKHVFDIAENYRAERIARTEVIKASNFAHEAGYIQSGVVEAKIWHTAVDERRCPFCAELHNKELSLGTNWFNQGDVMEVEGAKLKLDYEDVGYPPLHPNCFRGDTDIYTNKGWVNIKDIKISDMPLTLNPETRDLEWGIVLETINYLADDLVHITNRQNSFSMVVTSDHPFFGYKRVDRASKGRKLEPILIEGIDNLNSEFNFYTSSRWIGKSPNTIAIMGRAFETEDFCRFMGYYLSEGSTCKNGRGKYQVSIAQSNDYNRSIMWWFIDLMPFDKCYKGKDHIYIMDEIMGEYLYQFGKSYEKYIPDTIKELSPYYLNIFLDAYCMGDGSIKENKKWKGGQFKQSKIYATSSKRMADDIGELLIKSGKSISYSLRQYKGKVNKFANGSYIINHDIWIVSELTSQYKKFANMYIEPIDGSDLVYDIEVSPNHTILTRHNGKVVWGSNCRCRIIPKLMPIEGSL